MPTKNHSQSVITNIMLCVNILRENQIKNKSTRFLLSLAIADLAIGFIIMPITALHLFTDIKDSEALYFSEP